MAETDAALLSSSLPSPGRAVASVRYSTGRTIVWVTGEHDVSTVGELSEAFARAIAVDDTDLVVDLSNVRFMGASAVGVIVRARTFLRARSRSMVLRSPSPCAWRVLVACDLDDLVEAPIEHPPTAVVQALASWVPVPPAARVDPRPSVPTVAGPMEIAVTAFDARSLARATDRRPEL